MNILAAIKREERKLEKQLGKLQDQLDGVRDAAKALGRSANHSIGNLSAEARAKISKAQKRRWAKVKAGGEESCQLSLPRHRSRKGNLAVILIVLVFACAVPS